MNFARPLSSARIVWPAAALILSGPAVGIVGAQQPVGRDVMDATAALQLLSQGKYAEAAKLYEGIPANYPTSPLIPDAQFHLGYILYVTGEHDKAVALMQKTIAGKNVPADILELAYSFIPQILAAKAGKLQPDDPQRKATFLNVVKEFDVFLQKFPQSEEVESANFGKARALYSIQDFESAAAPLRANLQKFPNSQSLLDTQFMLALVLGTQSNLALKNATAPVPAADAAFEEAGKLFGEIISKRTDVAVSNDAQYQLGEMLFVRGNYQTKEKREPLLKGALNAYRAVLPKEQVIKAQQERIAAIAQRKADFFRAGDVNQSRKWQRFLEKEQEKTAAIAERADQTIPAKIKTAQIFLALERFDETRVLMRFLEPQLEEDDQKKLAQYFMALTYAAQNLTEKAVEYYDKFMTAYPKDPMGENLPLLVGAAFLASDKPEEAIKYFKEQTKLYPGTPSSADAGMREGLALIGMERYEDARKSLNAYLQTNPATEQKAGAELGLATISQRMGKIEDALKAYSAIRETYKGTFEGEQGAFYTGQLTLGNGDAKGAVKEIRKFLADYPNSELAPAGMLLAAQAQASAGDKPGAMETYKELAKKYAKSKPANAGYFQRAAIYQKDNQLAEVKALMKEFIATGPEPDQLYAAVDYIAQVQASEKAPLEAIATYEDYVAKNSQALEAPRALVKASALWKKYGEEQGNYTALNDQQRAEWQKGVNNAIKRCEEVLEKYPESAEVSLALQSLLACQKSRLRVKLTDAKGVESYFQDFAKKFDGKPATRSKILFTLASLAAEKDEASAITIMKSAYDDKLVYAPADLDLYGAALIKAKDFDGAHAVYTKLAADYPLPPNTTADKAPRGAIADAQAMSVFGFAKVLQAQNKKDEAAKKFAELKANFPSSPKGLEADFGIAEGEAAKKKYKEALALLSVVTRANQAPTNLRARAMMLVGQINEEQGEFDAAINNYIKLGTMFPAESDLAPEGFWRGAQLIEKKLKK